MTLGRFMLRFALIAVILVAAGGAYMAREVFGSTAATYSVGGIDLKIDSKAFYNTLPYPKSTWSEKDLKPYYDKFFNFSDVKPGDTGTTTISIHVKKSSSYVCLAFTDFKNQENGRNEPEALVDATAMVGELGGGLEFFAWHDDGDNTFEVGEEPLFGTTTQSAILTVKDKLYALADYTHGSAWIDGSIHYVGIAWCAGNMTVDLASANVSCDGSLLGNEAQTDSLSFSVMLDAVPSTKDKKYTCTGRYYEDEKETICHHTGSTSNPTEIIQVSMNALPAHLQHHGDYIIKSESDEKKCKDEEKQKLCHFTGSKSNPTEIIEVAKSAVSSHVQNHGDYVIKNKDDEKKCDRERRYEYSSGGYNPGDTHGNGGNCTAIRK